MISSLSCHRHHGRRFLCCHRNVHPNLRRCRLSSALITTNTCANSRTNGLAMNVMGTHSFAIVSTYVGGLAAMCTGGHSNDHTITIVYGFTITSAYIGGFIVIFAGTRGFITVSMCAGGLTITCANIHPTLSSTLRERVALLSTLRSRAASPSSIQPLCHQKVRRKSNFSIYGML